MDALVHESPTEKGVLYFPLNGRTQALSTKRTHTNLQNRFPGRDLMGYIHPVA